MFETTEPLCSTTETSSILQLLNDDSRDDPLGTALDFCFTQKPAEKQHERPASHFASQRLQSSVSTFKPTYSTQPTCDAVKASTNAMVSQNKASQNQFAPCSGSFCLELEDDDVKACAIQGSKKENIYQRVATANAGGFLLELESEDDIDNVNVEPQPKVGEVQVTGGKVASDKSAAARSGLSLELELDLDFDSPCTFEQDSKQVGHSDSALWKTDSLNDNHLLEAERIALQSMQDTKNALASVSCVSLVRPCCAVSPTRFDTASRVASTPNVQRSNRTSISKLDVSASDDSFVLPRRTTTKRHIVYSQAMTQRVAGASLSDLDAETRQKCTSFSDVDKSAVTIDSQSDSDESRRPSDAWEDDVVVIGESIEIKSSRRALPSTCASTRAKPRRNFEAACLSSPETESVCKARRPRHDAVSIAPARRETSRAYPNRCNAGRHAQTYGNTTRKRKVISKRTYSDTDVVSDEEADDESEKGAPRSKKCLRKNKKGVSSAFVWTQAVCKAVVSSDEDENLDESAIARELASFVAPSQSQSQSPSQLDRSAMHAVYLRTIRDDALALPANLAALLDRHTAAPKSHKRMTTACASTRNDAPTTDLSNNSYQFDSFCVADDVL